MGSPQLDENLLVGFDGVTFPGLPKGRLIEISGRPQSGVSTFCWAVALGTKKVAWVDGDLCGIPAGGLQQGDEADVYVLSPHPGVNWIEEIVTVTAPLLDVLVVDSWDVISADFSFPVRRHILALCADAAAQHNTTILVTTKLWQNSRTGLEFSKDDRLFRDYASLGLQFTGVHECQVTYSRIFQSGRRVWFDYPPGFRSRLDEGFAGQYTGA